MKSIRAPQARQSQPGRYGAVVLSAAAALLLAACGGAPKRPPADERIVTAPPVTPPVATDGAPRSVKPRPPTPKGGGYYKDDGPGDEIPEWLDEVPDAVPRIEPLHRFANNPYNVFGRDYVPMKHLAPYRARGIASWYGRKFHGQKTSSGEIYDMFAMTAAHPTLPIPSYARVTQLATGRSVVVRINDRGPFHANRLIDLSYTAGHKLGLIAEGSGWVEVELILPDATTPLAPLAALPENDPIARFAMAPASPEAEERGIWLQLGAFGNLDNAEAFRNHLGRELDWLAGALRLVSGDGWHRVRSGPYATRAEADAVAERIRLALGVRPTVVLR